MGNGGVRNNEIGSERSRERGAKGKIFSHHILFNFPSVRFRYVLDSPPHGVRSNESSRLWCAAWLLHQMGEGFVSTRTGEKEKK